MNEAEFWRILGLMNWKRVGNDDAVCKPAIDALAERDIADIRKFEQIMAEKLYRLDTEAHARQIGEDAYGGEHFSVDEFLYGRDASAS